MQHVVDVALAESALGAPFAGFGDVEVHPETWQKIAALGYRLARYHSLPDGNKRTARVAMREFAMRDGFEWSDPSEDEAVAVMEDAAAGSLRGGLRGMGAGAPCLRREGSTPSPLPPMKNA